ncbi:MAG: rod shape-determining protein MreC [Candidatus Melainabacteria bacterium RIFCSPHIGHO2_02_FULL_34_12]|nr:MAG: rod shape-determining protein MreC [Candidatus Melainabacteria bacterium RIFCSPHIGHO2_02_FULL_34_12]
MFLKKPLFIQSINPRTLFTLLLWLIIAWVLSRPLKGVGEFLYYSFGSVTNSAFENITHGKSSLEELIKAKNILKEKSYTVSILKTKIYELENEVEETKKLKEQLNLKRKLNYKTISSSVIARSADNWHKQIILDKGMQENIMQGDAVLTSKGIVGQVVEAGKHSSIVQLISDPSYKLGCKIQKKGIMGILSGKNNRTSLLEFIPVGTKVMLGDVVVTSGISSKGLNPVYPSGHPVGRIIRISKKKSKATDLYIEVKLFEDLNSLHNVLVFSP